MAFQGISTGSGPNVGDGDTLFSGALKINENFSEIYNALGDGTTISSNIQPDNIFTGIITATEINSTGNITVDGNATLGNQLTDNVTIAGSATVGSNLTVDGNVTLGNAASDTITVNGYFDSNLIPYANGVIDLGTSSLQYRNLYITGTATVDTLTVDESATITQNLTVNGNVDLGSNGSDTIDANGRFGTSLIPNSNNVRDLGDGSRQWRNLYIDGTGNIDTAVVDTLTVTGNTTLGNDTGDTVTATGDLTAAGTITGARVRLFDNTITTISGNDGLTLQSFNTNGVDVNGPFTTNGSTTLGDGGFDTHTLNGNTTINGNITATSGFNIGISSAGSNISNGPITRLNFAGEGNEISIDGNGVVSITIAGSGGAGGGIAPTVDGVTLTDTGVGQRFANETFTAAVTMQQEGSPVSQKGFKGILSGSFATFQEGSVSSSNVSITGTQSFENVYDILSNKNDFYLNDFGGDAGGGNNIYRSGLIIAATARGAGQGPGYYVATHYEGLGNPSTGTNHDVYRLHYTSTPPSNTSTAALLVTRDTTGGTTYTPDGMNSPTSPGAMITKINVLGEIAWYERIIERVRVVGGSATGATDFKPYGGGLWSDATGTFLSTNVTSYKFGVHFCSDGEYAFELQNTYDGVSTYRPRITIWRWDANLETFLFMGNYNIGSSLSNKVEMGMTYDKPSGRLIYVETTTVGLVYSWQINSIEYDASGQQQNVVLTDLETDVFSVGLDSETTAGYLKQLTYCGDAGAYMLFNEEWYRFNSTTFGWSIISDPDPTRPNFAHNGGLSSDDNGNLYWVKHISVSNQVTYLYVSTDLGSTWTTRMSTYTWQNSYTNPKPPGVGFGELILTYENWWTYASSTADEVGYRYGIKRLFSQTHTNSNASNFSTNNRIAKSGDEDNSDFLGYVSGKVGSTLTIKSKSPFNNGDALLNLDNFTTGTSTRYLNLDISGAVTGIQQSDPGFVELGPGLSFDIDFPGSLSSGRPTDDEIPAGTTLTVQVQATNDSASSNIVSDNVTPT